MRKFQSRHYVALDPARSSTSKISNFRMGAGQSSSSGNGTRGQEAVKTSYYELLGLDKTATEDE